MNRSSVLTPIGDCCKKFAYTGWFGLLLLSSMGCAKKAGGSGEVSTPTPKVKAANPQKKSLRWTIDQPGTIQAYESTPLIAKLPGFVKKVHVDIDDLVHGPSTDGTKPGTLLAELDMPEMVEDVKQKEALVAQANAEVELARKNHTASLAAIDSAAAQVLQAASREKAAKANVDRWRSELARVEALVKGKVVDQQTGDETRNQFIAAEGGFDEAKAYTAAMQAAQKEAEAKAAKAAAEVTAAQARGASAQADVRKSAALLAYAQIRAPYNGIVTGRMVHTGNFLQPGEGKTVTLFTVARIDLVRVVVEVPETHAGRIAKGQAVKVRVPGLRNAEYAGTIARTSWALNPDVHTLRVEIDLPNPDHKLRPGLYAQAGLTLDQAEATVLPTSAIQYQDDAAFCYLVQDGKAARYQVQLGQIDGDVIEVLRRKKVGPKEEWQPWNGSEVVVRSSKGALTDGVAVEIEP